MTVLGTDEILREEAKAIHGQDADTRVSNKNGAELYRALNGLNSAALCLSGGGIRSASFALGLLEALAVHPRPAANSPVADESRSLLCQIHYLSTVSGGGYVGSWLSAWIARSGYAEVWKRLVGRRDRPDEEPGEIAWLRAYSNYLTPRLGLSSADTWAAIALYVRNLILNWLVILPALCLLLFAIKLGAVMAYWLSGNRGLLVVLALLGVVLMVWVLRFATRNRPTCKPRIVVQQPAVAQGAPADARGEPDPHHNEAGRVATGADQKQFLLRYLLAALIAAVTFSLYMTGEHLKVVRTWELWQPAGLGAIGGAVLYAVAWFTASPFKSCKERRGIVYWSRDAFAWTAAGSIYGALVGLGAHFFVDPNPLLIGRPPVPETATRLLVLLIYGVPWIIIAQLIAEMIFVGLTSWERGSDADREWFGRSTGWFAAAAIMWFVVSFLILVGAELAYHRLQDVSYAKYTSTIVGLGSGIISAILGWSGKSPATDQGRARTRLPVDLILAIAPALFLITLVVAISVGMDYLLLKHGLLESPLIGAGDTAGWQQDWNWLWIGVVLVLIVAFFAWTHVNINRFSIHALYRNRLIRAYLGASHPDRAPNPFTGFDDDDNIRVAKLWPLRPGSWQPFHVVNIALNVVASSRLAWQERKAESFTVTPLHCGTASYAGTSTHSLGYRRTGEYADRSGGITLGTALAISGAAASPNMGYHSSPLVTLLLALFNVRLGWWLGNPGTPGDRSYDKEGPTIAILPFIYEMFGQTTDSRRFVYLSDGGHFENLGLYEMIRRRCRCIVISDAGCDPDYGFEDLGNAVRKIVIDLGVSITFGALRALKKRAKDDAVIEGAYYAVGVIDYRTAPEQGAENGYILYIKPSYHGTESAGIVAYAIANAAFPHETTGDQFFSESQFESYRSLGFEITDDVLREATRNIETINQAGTEDNPLVADRLCDLIRALDPDVIKRAEDALVPVPSTPSDTIKSLDPDALAVLRGVFGPGGERAPRRKSASAELSRDG